MNERGNTNDTTMRRNGDAVPHRAAHGLMMVCCLAMVGGICFVAFGSWRATGSVDWAGTILPLLVCGGAHLLMMAVMGRSCHSSAPRDVDETAPEAVPTDPVSMPEPTRAVVSPPPMTTPSVVEARS